MQVFSTTAYYPTENAEILRKFLAEHENIYTRENQFVHLTASGFILSHNLDQAGLIFHNKYQSWLMPGGHIDNQNEGAHPYYAALRECLKKLVLMACNLLKKHPLIRLCLTKNSFLFLILIFT